MLSSWKFNFEVCSCRKTSKILVRLASPKHLTILWVETDWYHFFETDTDIFKIFSPMFGQLPIFHWPLIPIFQNLLYRYVCRTFNIFLLQLVWIAYSPSLLTWIGNEKNPNLLKLLVISPLLLLPFKNVPALATVSETFLSFFLSFFHSFLIKYCRSLQIFQALWMKISLK